MDWFWLVWIQVSERWRRLLGIAIAGLLLSLTVAACGGSSQGSETNAAGSAAAGVTRPSFVTRVGQLCARTNQRVASVPYFVGQGGSKRYETRETAIARSAVRSLASIRAPASMASGYAQFVRLNTDELTDLRLAQDAAASDQHAKSQRLRLDAVNASQSANLVALELGLGYCAYDVEPLRFIGRTAPQRLAAKLDEACAPAVSADQSFKLDLVLAGDRRRAGKITEWALLQQIAIAFDNYGGFSNSAARAMSGLKAPANLEPVLRDLVTQLQQSAALSVNTAVAMNDKHPIDLPEIASALEQSARRVGRDGAKFEAVECEAI